MSQPDESQFDARSTRELMRVTRVNAVPRNGDDPLVLGVEFEVRDCDRKVDLRRGDRLTFNAPTTCASGQRFLVLVRGAATRIDRGIPGEPAVFRVLAEMLSRSPHPARIEQAEPSFAEFADHTLRLLSETLQSLEGILLQRPEYALRSEARDVFSRVHALLNGASLTSAR
jgi:hypothetical protein